MSCYYKCGELEGVRMCYTCKYHFCKNHINHSHNMVNENLLTSKERNYYYSNGGQVYKQTCSYSGCKNIANSDGRCDGHGLRGVQYGSNGKIIYDGR